MNPNAYRKMIDKIHVSDAKRNEITELLKFDNNGVENNPEKSSAANLSKWLSKPYIRRYVAAAACAALVLTGVIIGYPRKSVPTADNAIDSESENSDVVNSDAESSLESTAPSTTEATLSNSSSPTSAIQPTASRQKYYFSMNPVYPKTFSFNDSSAKTVLLADNPLDQNFISAVKNFSWRTFSKLTAGKSGNITYSPTSVYMALAMAETGSRGKTQKEFNSLLGVQDSAYLSSQCGNLFRRSYFSNEVGTMRMADSLWLNQYCPFENSFVQNSVNNFYASINNIDFSDKSAGDKISNWISENTNGILKPNIRTDCNELLSIVNTIYFKDEWVNGFDPKNTAKANFTMANGNQKSWDFMNATIDTGYFDGDGYKTASLAMKNVGNMVFVLPDEGVKPEDLIRTPEKLSAALDLSKCEKRDVIFSIPKFSMGNSQIQLKDMLQSLGLKSAFDSSGDFSGISKIPSYIQHVQHGAHVQIYESGATAAAYTEIGLDTAYPLPYNLTLDRPFLYAIISNDGIPLFLGICQEPVNE